jgi:hypothetical protein
LVIKILCFIQKKWVLKDNKRGGGIMRCDLCGNTGVVNGNYCNCGHGIYLAMKTGSYHNDSEYEKVLADTYIQYEKLFSGLGEYQL